MSEDVNNDPKQNIGKSENAMSTLANLSYGRWRLMRYAFEGGDSLTSKPSAALELDDTKGKLRIGRSYDACQIEAFTNCAKNIIQSDFKLRSYEVRVDWCDKGKWIEGTLTIESGGNLIKAYGQGSSVIDAFIKALIRALNIIEP